MIHNLWLIFDDSLIIHSRKCNVYEKTYVSDGYWVDHWKSFYFSACEWYKVSYFFNTKIPTVQIIKYINDINTGFGILGFTVRTSCSCRQVIDSFRTSSGLVEALLSGPGNYCWSDLWVGFTDEWTGWHFLIIRSQSSVNGKFD